MRAVPDASQPSSRRKPGPTRHLFGRPMDGSRLSPGMRLGLHGRIANSARAAPRPGRNPMKIARIESFIFGTKSSKDLLFWRLESGDGTYGWGEASVAAGKETVIAECLKAMTPHVSGRGVFNTRHTGQVMFEDFAIRR